MALLIGAFLLILVGRLALGRVRTLGGVGVCLLLSLVAAALCVLSIRRDIGR